MYHFASRGIEPPLPRENRRDLCDENPRDGTTVQRRNRHNDTWSGIQEGHTAVHLVVGNGRRGGRRTEDPVRFERLGVDRIVRVICRIERREFIC